MGSKKNSANNLSYLVESGDSSNTKGEQLPPLGTGGNIDSVELARIKLLNDEERTQYISEQFGELTGKGRSVSGGGADSLMSMSGGGDVVALGNRALDLSLVVSTLGVVKSMKSYNLLQSILDSLLVSVLINNTTNANSDDMSKMNDNGDNVENIKLVKKDVSAVPPSAALGSLLLVRALAETCLGVTEDGRNRKGRAMECYLSPLAPHCLAFLSSQSTNVRNAASDAVVTILNSLNPTVGGCVLPFIENKMSAFYVLLQHSDWRVKLGVLDAIRLLSRIYPESIHLHIPVLIPALAGVVWDTKPQVSRGAGMALKAVCDTNMNVDVRPCMGPIVLSIVKPNETVKAVEALCHTTFVVPVDASTLSILCPVLARCLQDKKSLNKRMACIVIDNMSKLVEHPTAVRPFGRLLVPGLKDVCDNVQFEDIRDTALSALGSLCKALGHTSIEEATEAYMRMVQEEVLADEKRIRDEREKEERERIAREEQDKKERKEFKDAMEAERLLENLRIEEERQIEIAKKKAQADERKSVKKSGGKCKSCGLKKCKKSCLFYDAKK